MASDPALALVATEKAESPPRWLSAPPLVEFCPICWGQRRILEPGPLGLVPVACPGCVLREC